MIATVCQLRFMAKPGVGMSTEHMRAGEPRHAREPDFDRAPVADKERQARERQNARGFIAQLGEEIRHLQAKLKEVHAGAEVSPDAETAQQLVDERWASARKLFERNRGQINELLTAIAGCLDRDPGVREWMGREVTELENLWEDLQSDLDERAGAPTPTAAYLAAEATKLDHFILTVGYLTVPTRLNDHLLSYRPGQVLLFSEEFQDELPTQDLQTKMLAYLYSHPSSVNGVVDLQDGTVTKVSDKGWRRAASVVGLVALAAAVVGIAAVLPVLGTPGIKPDVDGGELATSVGWVLVGTAAHTLVGALKDLRRAATDNRRRFASIGNWLFWAHAREVYIAAAIFWAGVLAVVFAGLQGRTDALTLLAVGYAGDSLVEVLLPKFEKAVQGRTEKVTALIK